MSNFGHTLFGGSAFIRWALSPFVLLFAVAVVALALIAYSCGLSGRRRLPANLTFAFLIALVFVIILDIDRPRQGFVRVSDASLVRLQQSLPALPK